MGKEWVTSGQPVCKECATSVQGACSRGRPLWDGEGSLWGSPVGWGSLWGGVPNRTGGPYWVQRSLWGGGPYGVGDPIGEGGLFGVGVPIGPEFPFEGGSL